VQCQIMKNLCLKGGGGVPKKSQSGKGTSQNSYWFEARRHHLTDEGGVYGFHTKKEIKRVYPHTPGKSGKGGGGVARFSDMKSRWWWKKKGWMVG